MLKKISQVTFFLLQGGSLRHLIKRKFFGHPLRQLLDATPQRYWGHSARRINAIMGEESFDYLEIGVAYGTTFQAVRAQRRVAVDPKPLFDTERLPANVTVFNTDSDSFFRGLPVDEMFDFIFLDGLHEANQLKRDLVNALGHLRPGGWILVDDVVPSDSISAIPSMADSYVKRGVKPSEGFPWHGDCFRILPWIFEKNFLTTYLIIYPDNPQLLLKVNDFSQCKSFLEKELNDPEEIMKLDYSEVFTSDSMSRMPLYVEELLMNKLCFA